jgi:hypothetical protein
MRWPLSAFSLLESCSPMMRHVRRAECRSGWLRCARHRRRTRDLLRAAARHIPESQEVRPASNVGIPVTLAVFTARRAVISMPLAGCAVRACR